MTQARLSLVAATATAGCLLVLPHHGLAQARSEVSRAASMNAEVNAGLNLVEAKLRMLRAAKVDLREIEVAVQRAKAESTKLNAAVRADDPRAMQQVPATARALRETFDLINPVLKSRPAGRLPIAERNRFNTDIARSAVAFVEAKLTSRKQQNISTAAAETKLRQLRQRFEVAIEDASGGMHERVASAFLDAFEDIDALFTELNRSVQR